MENRILPTDYDSAKMKTPPPSPETIARRKFAKARKLLGEVCGHTGRDSITVRVDHVPDDRPAVTIISEPSHAPTRHPDKRLPPPKPGQRADSGLLHDAVSLELERRQEAAKRWSAETGHESGLHHASISEVDWKPVHHRGCASETTSGGACDCGPIFLARFADQIFAVASNGQLERFTAPQKPADFFADQKAFYFDQSFDVSEWVLPLLAETVEFTVAGNGATEHFVEFPTESDIETRAVQ